VQLADRARWLRRECIPRLDAELQTDFPLVVIHPTAWVMTTDDGRHGITYAYMGPFAIEPALAVFAIHLSGAAAIAMGETLIEGLLIHEWLHYVWSSLRGLEGEAKPGAVQEPVDLTAEGLFTTAASYEAVDRTIGVAVELWLTNRLQNLLRRADDNQDAGIVDGQRHIVAAWMQLGLPVEDAPRTFDLLDVMIDRSLVEQRQHREGK
jgi:hypothetical protein